jgi:predicted transcriptional regulator
MEKKEKVLITLYIDAEDKKKLMEYAQETGMNMSMCIRQAIKKYIKSIID